MMNTLRMTGLALAIGYLGVPAGCEQSSSPPAPTRTVTPPAESAKTQAATGSTESPATSKPAQSAPAAAEDKTPSTDKELNLFCWSEYVPQSVIDGFTKETGIEVRPEYYASNEEMLSKLVAGAAPYDLIQPSEYTVEALIKRGMLAELDFSKLPNFKNIDPKMTHLGHDPDQKYTVPWMTGTVGIVVNTEKIKDPIKSYTDVFQDKYAGRIVVLDDNREMASWALATLGIRPNDITKENLAKAEPVLKKWVKLIKVYDSDAPRNALGNGDVDLGIVWSGEGAKLYEDDKKWAWVLPAEGAHMFIDSLCIPKTAPHKDAAHRFMNYILRPEVSKLISDAFPYTNPNLEARKLLSAAQKANPASYPPGEPKMDIFHDLGETASDIAKLVTDVKAGS